MPTIMPDCSSIVKRKKNDLGEKFPFIMRPWDFDMTLCIAARCREHAKASAPVGLPRIAICLDWRIETPAASAETELKFEVLTNSWNALYAGSIPQAHELIDLYRVYLNEHIPTDELLIEGLRRPLRRFRGRIAETYIQNQLAVSYRYFLKNGAREFPAEVHYRLVNEIASQTIGVELILMGYKKGLFRLFKIAAGEVWECRDFAAIGSGSAIAEPLLYRRQQNEMCSVAETIYAIFEAKKLAEMVPGVGSHTTILLSRPQDSRKTSRVVQSGLTPTGMDFLHRKFRELGPKEMDHQIELPTDFFGAKPIF